MINHELTEMLSQAWKTFTMIAATDEPVGIARQTVDELPAMTPYDHASSLVRSLLPFVYGYEHSRYRDSITKEIWISMIEALQILSDDDVLKIIDAGKDECDRCGHGLLSYGHYAECQGYRHRGDIVTDIRPEAK